jgi:hypothetical protein
MLSTKIAGRVTRPALPQAEKACVTVCPIVKQRQCNNRAWNSVALVVLWPKVFF